MPYSNYMPEGTTYTSKIGIPRHIPYLPDHFNQAWFENFIRDFITKNILENLGVRSGCVISQSGTDMSIAVTSGEIDVDGVKTVFTAPAPTAITEDGWYVCYINDLGQFIPANLTNTTVQGAATPNSAVLVGYVIKQSTTFFAKAFYNKTADAKIEQYVTQEINTSETTVVNQVSEMIEGQLMSHIIPYMAYPFIDGRDGDATAFAALSDHAAMPGVKIDSLGKIRFWTTIRGRKPIVFEPGAKSGMDRMDFDSLQLLDDEFGPNGEPVYAVDGRENVRVVGEGIGNNDSNGNVAFYYDNLSTAKSIYIEVIGFFNELNMSHLTNANEVDSISFEANGNVLTTVFNPRTAVLSPLYGRYLDCGSVMKTGVSSEVSLGLNSINIIPKTTSGSGYLRLYYIELGIDSDQVTVMEQNVVAQGKKKKVAYGQISQKPDVWAANYGKVGYDGYLDQGLSVWGFGENVKAAVAVHNEASSQYAGTPLNVYDWVVDTTDVAAYQVLNPFKLSGIHQAVNGSTQVNWSSPYSYTALPASGGAVVVGNLYYSATYSKLYKCIQSGELNYATQNDIDNSELFAYRRPINGYRTCLASYDGIITTDNRARATRWISPAARHIGNSAIDERASGQQRPVFEAGDIDFDGQELVKVINWREFGNGDKNGDTATGFDTLSTSPSDRAFVLDDGLTSFVGSGIQQADSSNDILLPTGDANYSIQTCIISGLRLKSKGPYASIGNVFSNVPFGTIITKLKRNSDYTTKIHVNNIELGDYIPNSYGGWGDAYIYQPKLPDLPEGACVIAEYMGMADPVSPTEEGVSVIGKGVRRVHATREVFYDSPTASPVITPLMGIMAGGFYLSHPAVNTEHTSKLPFFGTGIAFDHYNNTNSVSTIYVKIDGNADLSAYNIVMSGFTIANINLGTFTPDNSTASQTAFIAINGIPTGDHILEVRRPAESGLYTYGSSVYDIYSPIHRSNHYSKLTYNPYVSPELVGGGDGINNDNLIVSGDGKILEDLRRPDKGTQKASVTVARNDDSSYLGDQKFNSIRGENRRVRDFIAIPATGQCIAMKNLDAKISVRIQAASAGIFASIRLNGTEIPGKRYLNAIHVNGIVSELIHLKKGDAICGYSSGNAYGTAEHGYIMQVEEI